MVLLESHGLARNQCNFFLVKKRNSEVEQNENEKLQIFI